MLLYSIDCTGQLSRFTRYRTTRPCITGHPVAKYKHQKTKKCRIIDTVFREKNYLKGELQPPYPLNTPLNITKTLSIPLSGFLHTVIPA